MPPSSRTRTAWSSASDPDAAAVATAPSPSPQSAAALVELEDVWLRFVAYRDKHRSLKRAALDLLLRRDAEPTTSAFWALRGVGLRIGRGERLGVVGRNGAGKSTLLRLLARIYPPTRGAVTVRGTVAPLIEMGAGFNPELSGRDNILLNGAMLGLSRRQMRRRTGSILEFTGLGAFADVPLKYYSSGMAARLAFAVATEVDPDVLLIDEALGAGDAAFAALARERIGRLLGRSGAVVLVSHDLGSLRGLCERGVWVDAGRVRADGPIDEVIGQYLAEVAPEPARIDPH